MAACWVNLTKNILSCGVARANLNVSLPLSSAFHTTSLTRVGQDWRKKQGMPANPNAYGPMTDGPDYSFVDGRPTPPGTGRVKRAIKQHEISTKILELTHEVDFAVDYHNKRVADANSRKQELIARKLKPKGKPDLD